MRMFRTLAGDPIRLPLLASLKTAVLLAISGCGHRNPPPDTSGPTRLAHSSLCDGAGYARHFERLYRAIWRRACMPSKPSSAPPDGIYKLCCHVATQEEVWKEEVSEIYLAQQVAEMDSLQSQIRDLDRQIQGQRDENRSLPVHTWSQ